MGLLEGRVALITGSGRGIGAATAKLFADQGAAVVVSDLDSAPAQETAEAIRGAGGRALVVAGDVTDRLFPAALLQATIDTYGGLDILVNNAGFPWDGPADSMTDQQWDAMLDVHASAPFRILREASHFIRGAARKEQAAAGRPRARKVINVSSVAGLYGNAGQVNYSSAKAAVIGLTKALSREWGCYNVQVNCAVFGFIDTRLTAPKDAAGGWPGRGERGIALGIPAPARQLALLRIPLGRPGTPEEAAGAMLFLASPLSDYVSGSLLEVTGGFVP